MECFLSFFSYISQKKENMDKKVLAFVCLLILSGLTGVYSQDTDKIWVKSGYVKVPEGSLLL